MDSSLKTVVVLGAAYGGCRAAQILAGGLPEGWRVLLVDRNSHMNNVYIFPRVSVLPGHEHKAFIPLSKVFLSDNPSHRCLHATVTSIRTDSVTLSRAFPEHGLPSPTVPYDYMIYALGSVLPAPLDLWRADPASKLPLYHGTKPQGIAWMKQHQEIVKDAQSVLVVGGGALGIRTSPQTLLAPDLTLCRIRDGHRDNIYREESHSASFAQAPLTPLRRGHARRE
ncbi:hypothetical protein C0993_001791 [Termitomyces sp. T159_Od127]|nr:hypothetical protein C0993_001791 [Termitomyces sp. T159_Od127]